MALISEERARSADDEQGPSTRTGFDARSGNPVRSLLSGLLQEVQGVVRLILSLQSHLYLLAAPEQFAHLALLHQVALLQDSYSIAHLLHFVKNMAGKEDRLAQRR